MTRLPKPTLWALGLLSFLGTPTASHAGDAPAPSADTATAAPAEPKPPELDLIPLNLPPVERAAPVASKGEDSVQLDTVVVTANKRKESARKIAGGISAIDSAQLSQAGASNFGEYLSLSPGVNFSSGTPGYSVVSIRGVSSDTVPSQAQTAVGIYFDDIPLTDPGIPVVVPDIDAFDAQRVEVLRGPQGALYGSASLGGAINYIPKLPNANQTEVAFFGSGSLQENSSLGGTGKAMVNLPIADGLALRAVGYYIDMPGFIDNLGTGEDEANKATIQGGRAILGWQVAPGSDVRLTYLHQETDVDDVGYVDENLGDLKKSTLEPEPTRNKFDLLGLRYDQDLAYGTVSLILGGQKKSNLLSYDGTTALGLQSTGQRVPLSQQGDLKGYSTELRFVSPSDDFFEFLAGVSYADRKEDVDVSLNAATVADATSVLDALGLLPPGTLADLTLFEQTAQVKAPEAAVFADTTFHFGPDVKLTAGGRYYDNKVDSDVMGRGLLLAPSGSTEFAENRQEKASGFNPKVSISWQALKRAMVYALYSKGYRLGGPNQVPSTPVSPTKRSYGPDTVNNYEIGAKTRWFNGRLTFDVAGFLIDWKDIPLIVTDSSGLFKYLDNAGNAQIKGVETSIVAAPVSFLSLRSSITWTDARLQDDFDPNNGRPPAEKGDRLPGSPEWTIANTVTGHWNWDGRDPTVTLIHRYESASATNLSFQEVKKGDFNTFDLRSGLHFGAFGLTAYCKNLLDKRGVTAANNYAQTSGDILSLEFITPPRLLGLELTYTFDGK